ncbi:MAG: hypothetical protein AMJ78_00790 [Omnitrophica WOR_2 bacterium SM23_29]|nr:MAG: hypothetical protein AMJ78_00790 [Omnitrophica WOR_2 bacterium SM23_29]
MEKKDYSKFIQKLTHKQRQEDGSYKTVTNEYMMVDGRVKEFTDIHKEQGKKFKFSRKFEKDQEGNLICYAKVYSQIFGVVEASAGAYGQTMVDKSNPYENAETSAYGRCLGFFGIGLLGGGIATAEEVKDALDRQEKVEIPQPKKEEKITPLQSKYIHKLSEELTLKDEDYLRILQDNFKVTSSADLTKSQASKFIDILKGYRQNAS